MKVDYSKFNFNKDECNRMKKETDILQEKNPDHVPILIILKSNVLNIEKQKFLVSNNIAFSHFITNILKKRLIGLYPDDTLLIHSLKLNPDVSEDVESSEVIVNSMTIKDIYDELKDESTNLLILRISRVTTYKLIKNSVKYWIGY